MTRYILERPRGTYRSDWLSTDKQFDEEMTRMESWCMYRSAITPSIGKVPELSR